ncbi:hypothetical protein [Aureimonas ureilytica]|uniref:hypothetical protein n=1 Tax=Aureimonas ureilytica TaxID=401562 RepID=UPI00128FB91F|nr:hypothetical protein [Aureimonas ureilytica]
MDGITVGAVGAAIIAGLVSILGLVIGKEQKVSEFRQAWIDELRKCLVSYLSNINAIADTIRTRGTSPSNDNSALIAHYKLLNEASNGIILRVNSSEKPSKALLKSMKEFEDLSSDNSRLTPENIKKAEKNFLNASKKLLKFEWKRVKRGESTFVWTKRIVITVTSLLLAFFIYSEVHSYIGSAPAPRKPTTISFSSPTLA